MDIQELAAWWEEFAETQDTDVDDWYVSPRGAAQHILAKFIDWYESQGE